MDGCSTRFAVWRLVAVMGELRELAQRLLDRGLIHFGPSLELSHLAGPERGRLAELPFPLPALLSAALPDGVLPEAVHSGVESVEAPSGTSPSGFSPSGGSPSGTSPSGSSPSGTSDWEAVACFSATAALACVVDALGLEPGARVLCPAYNCGHELEPLLRRGLRLDFYRIDEQMVIDLDDVRERLAGGCAAVLVTHYFGFPGDTRVLRELADRAGALLIEDCAHAFASRGAFGSLGETADACVFSLRKSLPLPDGGVAAWRKGRLRRAPVRPRQRRAPPLAVTLCKSIDLWQKQLMRASSRERFLWTRFVLLCALPLLVLRRLWPRVASDSGTHATTWYDPDDERFDFDECILDWAMSPLAGRILRRVDPVEMRRRRRLNYETLAGLLSDRSELLVFPELPPEACPLHLPIRCRDRAGVAMRLYEAGITAGVWWDHFHPAVLWGRYPEAVALKREVLALPIHQDLGRAQLERMAAVLERALRA